MEWLDLIPYDEFKELVGIIRDLDNPLNKYHNAFLDLDCGDIYTSIIYDFDKMNLGNFLKKYAHVDGIESAADEAINLKIQEQSNKERITEFAVNINRLKEMGHEI